MAERGTAVGAWDREHEQALVADVRHDDPGLARVPIPLERDRVISVLARVSSSMNTAGSFLAPVIGPARPRFEASMVRDAPPDGRQRGSSRDS